MGDAGQVYALKRCVAVTDTCNSATEKNSSPTTSLHIVLQNHKELYAICVYLVSEMSKIHVTRGADFCPADGASFPSTWGKFP